MADKTYTLLTDAAGLPIPQAEDESTGLPMALTGQGGALNTRLKEGFNVTLGTRSDAPIGEDLTEPATLISVAKGMVAAVRDFNTANVTAAAASAQAAALSETNAALLAGLSGTVPTYADLPAAEDHTDERWQVDADESQSPTRYRAVYTSDGAAWTRTFDGIGTAASANLDRVPLRTLSLTSDLRTLSGYTGMRVAMAVARAASYGPVLNMIYISDPDDSLTGDDGVMCLVDADGVRWKLQPSPSGYDVRAWGFGGAAAANTAALQSAIDTLSGAGGGAVVVPEGTYDVDGAVQIKSGVTLRGSGPGSVIRAAAGSNPEPAVLYAGTALEPVENIAIDSITIDGNKANRAIGLPDDPTHLNNIELEYVTNVQIGTIWSVNAAWNGLVLTQAESVQIGQVYCHTTGKNGVYISAGCENVQIEQIYGEEIMDPDWIDEGYANYLYACCNILGGLGVQIGQVYAKNARCGFSLAVSSGWQHRDIYVGSVIAIDDRPVGGGGANEKRMYHGISFIDAGAETYDYNTTIGHVFVRGAIAQGLNIQNSRGVYVGAGKVQGSGQYNVLISGSERVTIGDLYNTAPASAGVRIYDSTDIVFRGGRIPDATVAVNFLLEAPATTNCGTIVFDGTDFTGSTSNITESGSTYDVTNLVILPSVRGYSTARLDLEAPDRLVARGNVHLRNGAIALRVGADSGADTITDATTKFGRIAVPHYQSAEEPVGLIGGNSQSGANQVLIGGGSSLLNAATQILLYTAATSTTTTGTVRQQIDANGKVTFPAAAPVQITNGPLLVATSTDDGVNKLQVAGSAKVSVDMEVGSGVYKRGGTSGVTGTRADGLAVSGGIVTALGAAAAGLTEEQVDDRVAALLAAGVGIVLTYDDAAGTLTIKLQQAAALADSATTITANGMSAAANGVLQAIGDTTAADQSAAIEGNLQDILQDLANLRVSHNTLLARLRASGVLGT